MLSLRSAGLSEGRLQPDDSLRAAKILTSKVYAESRSSKGLSCSSLQDNELQPPPLPPEKVIKKLKRAELESIVSTL